MKTRTIPHYGRGVSEFVAAHGDKVTGVISGFDRLRLQGTLRALYVPEIFQEYLWRAKVLCKDFKPHLTAVTERICTAAETLCGTEIRPARFAGNRPGADGCGRGIAAQKAKRMPAS